MTATLDGNKTFVTLQGKDLNSFGDATIVGTDGFQQSLLRSIYRSQRDKRELICSDYPKILEECGGVVRKSTNLFMKVLKDSQEIIKEKFTSTEVSEIPAQKKVKPVEETKPTKRKWWKGTLFKCKVGCRYAYWDSEGNDYDEDGNLITK